MTSRLTNRLIGINRRPACRYSTSSSTTHFGAQTVTPVEKEEKVSHVFTNVATRYDITNDAMSLMMQRHWKHHFVRKLRLSNEQPVDYVDVATGTGDIGLACAQRLLPRTSATRSTVTLTDVNKSMMDEGHVKAKGMLSEEQNKKITWTVANAEKLPFESSSFDLYTITFGIRNCTNVDTVLSEAHRVLRPGGRFVCMEFGKVDNSLLAGLYDWYSYNLIPPMGHLIAGDWKSYQYLVESIRQFPSQSEFAGMIEDAGFSNVKVENMSCGIVAIHSATK